MRMVMGGETEYAISARRADGRPMLQGPLLQRFFEHATRVLGYTSASTRGRFLSNGGLFYLDAGLHMEWATPEVTSPYEVVRYLAAGDRIVHDLAQSLVAADPEVAEVFCSRASVDYVSGTAWASHESYGHRVAPALLPEQLTPFLASRVVLGAGGWDYRSPSLRFTLSPRAHFITVLADRDSQHVRPLFHTKDEPLSGTGTHRLHVACSESLCSQTANILRFGTTALVLALLEQGGRPAADVTLATPVRALQQFAADPDLRTAARLTTGQAMTALELQRHYLVLVEERLGDLAFPWAEDVCVLWRRTLDDLECRTARGRSVVDWAIKHRLFSRRLERHGLTWDDLRRWDTCLRRLGAAWKPNGEPAFDVTLALSPEAELRGQMDRLVPSLHRRGLTWDGLPGLVAARHELFELDARFGALDETGVFNALDTAGALQHRVRELDVSGAVAHPPHDTRARIRGTVVQRLSAEGVGYGAEWTGVYDRHRRRELDLMDPFETQERWHDLPPLDDPLSESRP